MAPNTVTPFPPMPLASNPNGAHSRYNRGLRNLQAAHIAAEAERDRLHDSGPELEAMQALVSVLYTRAQEGDTEQWRQQLKDAAADGDLSTLQSLIRTGCAEDELYNSVFDKFDRLGEARRAALSEETKRQHVITQAQVLELLAILYSDLRAELDPATYGRLAPRLLRRTPDIGLERRLETHE